jgi:murein DD-endopeptidase MepM/ murein hydrolase activator NlpD
MIIQKTKEEIMKGKTLLLTVLSLIISSLVFFVGITYTKEPKELYRVYLAGDTIGYIKDKNLLEEYIDKEQVEIKQKYKVDRVYPPNDLDIVKEITYTDKIKTEKEIYEEIKDISPFTVNGYIITIKGTDTASEEKGSYKTDDVKVHVLDKSIFEKSIKDAVQAFIPEETYNSFINETQAPIKETGSIIEDIYLKNSITIREGRISAEEKIFTTSEELDRFLLFGTTEEQKKYTVQAGDTISDIAQNNKLNVMEFLVANPDFTSENNLLYEGQEVNLGLINPPFSLVEEDHVVTLETTKFETKIEYDDQTLAGYDKVKQEGEDGLSRVTRKVQKVNGETVQVVTTNTEVLKPAVDKIIVKGTKVIPSIAIAGVWAWPTNKPYMISSGYGWRWGKLHEGVDITGTGGYGSPIYAANNGTVTTAVYDGYNGNYIIIDHGNGILTVYAHLASLGVSAGQVVEMGQQIGTMGMTGYATGVHLHFSFYREKYYTGRGLSLNPMDFY